VDIPEGVALLRVLPEIVANVIHVLYQKTAGIDKGVALI